jgi:predicted phage terminase large subunit-like protein
VSDAKEYPHQRLLDGYIVAQMEGRLYFDGPGPLPVESGLLTDDGFPILVHPERNDSPVYNLAISMPPRHGKSYLVSEHLPAWFLTKFPDYSVLLASYNETFAGEWGEKCRDHVLAHPEFGIDIVGHRGASKFNWNIVGHRGFMKCAGVGGTLTGKGGHLLIVDDPIKNAEEAMSAILRDNQDNWWRSTLYTRREPWADGTPGRVILMATRWHEDDLTGRRVPKEPVLGDTWCLLNLPAIAEAADPFGRPEGSALCPERVGIAELLSTREEMGTSWFQAMFQGSPSLDDGNIIQRPFNYYSKAGDTYRLHDPSGNDTFADIKGAYRFGTLDMAASERKGADWTVLGVFDILQTNPRMMVVAGIERVRITVENHERIVEEWYHKHNLRALHIENKTFGTNLIARLMRKQGMILQKLSGDQQPMLRALPVQYEIRNGRVWFPKNAEWLSDFEAELTKFPLATHDDQVDVLAYGVEVFQHLPAFVVKDREPETMDEKVQAHRKQLARKNTKRKSLRSIYPTLGRL